MLHHNLRSVSIMYLCCNCPDSLKDTLCSLFRPRERKKEFVEMVQNPIRERSEQSRLATSTSTEKCGHGMMDDDNVGGDG